MYFLVNFRFSDKMCHVLLSLCCVTSVVDRKLKVIIIFSQKSIRKNDIITWDKKAYSLIAKTSFWLLPPATIIAEKVMFS